MAMALQMQDRPLSAAVASFYEHPSLLRDAAPLYRRLQKEDPVHKSSLGFWVISKHADALRLLKEGLTARTPPYASHPGSAMDRLFRGFLTMAPREEHGRLRKAVQGDFTPFAVRRLSAEIEQTIDRCLEPLRGRGTMDMVGEFAEIVPAEVICGLLGVPIADRPEFLSWLVGIVGGYLPGTVGSTASSAEKSASALLDYMLEIIRERQGHPGADLVSSLVKKTGPDRELSEQELLGVVCHVFVAGVHSTISLLANSVFLMLSHSEQAQRVRADPLIVGTALEECLRMEPPIRMMPMRVATEEIEIAGHRIQPGEDIDIWIGAANRDPEVFTSPNEFNVERDNNHHLSFSKGMNFCLGSHLARLEGRLALQAILTEFPDLRLSTQDVEYRDMALVHAPKALFVERSS